MPAHTPSPPAIGRPSPAVSPVGVLATPDTERPSSGNSSCGILSVLSGSGENVVADGSGVGGHRLSYLPPGFGGEAPPLGAPVEPDATRYNPQVRTDARDACGAIPVSSGTMGYSICARLNAGEVVVDLGQIDRLSQKWLNEMIGQKRVTKWRGHWFPVAGASFGIGPLKNCYGLPEVADGFAGMREAFERSGATP